MKKTIAIPVRLQKDHLSEEEREELKKYGEQLMTPEEIEAIEAEQQANELEAQKATIQQEINDLQAQLDQIDIAYARALRRGDESEQEKLKTDAENLETDLQSLQNDLLSISSTKE